MIKYLLTFVILVSLVFTGKSQSSLGKTDDMGRVAIAAIVPDEAGVQGGSQRMLQNKMMQIASQNGLGATEDRAQFVMVPMITIINKDVTPTAPPQVSLRIEVSLYIVDVMSRTIFNQTSIELRGVGNTEERAYTQALNSINPRHGQFRGFIEKSKEKIIEYYNSQCDALITKAKALAGQKKYEEALFSLLFVPDVSRECYDKCMNISMDIYKDYGNQKCNEFLAAARAAWAAKELNKVEENLSKITPDMACYPQAEQLLAQITSAVEAEGAGAWSFKMKKYDDSVKKEQLLIEAGRDVAKAWAYWGAAPYFDWKWLYKN